MCSFIVFHSVFLGNWWRKMCCVVLSSEILIKDETVSVSSSAWVSIGTGPYASISYLCLLFPGVTRAGSSSLGGRSAKGRACSLDHRSRFLSSDSALRVIPDLETVRAGRDSLCFCCQGPNTKPTCCSSVTQFHIQASSFPPACSYCAAVQRWWESLQCATWGRQRNRTHYRLISPPSYRLQHGWKSPN